MLRSESPLSDINDIPTTTISSVTGAEDADHSDDDAIHDMATSELDDEEDAPGEEDADFDEETPPPEPAHHMRQDSSSSEGSLRPGKRKAEMIDDEEYMKQNPELYGLRRSVCVLLPKLRITLADMSLLGPRATKSPSGTCWSL
jgi:chromodomain-helicase-DNA-binding protein 1